MFKENKKTKNYLFFCFIGLAILFLYPNITPAYFGLLDDGQTINISQKILSSSNINLLSGGDSGRFVPLYWLHHIMLYILFGISAVSYYIFHAFILGVVLFMIYKITYLITKKQKISILASFLYLLSLPVVESYYTLGKPEAQQALYLVFMLYFYIKTDTYLAKNKKAQIPKKLFVFSLIPLFLLYFTKETSFAMLPLSFFWMIFVWWTEKSHKTNRSKTAILFFTANIIALISHQILKTITGVASISTGGYTNMYQISSPKALFIGFGKWLTILMTNNIVFIITSTILIILLIKKIKKTGLKQTTITRNEQLLVFFLMFSLFWTAIFIPWAILMDRYFLPAMIGTSIFVALFLNYTIENKKNTLKKIATIAIILNLIITIPVYTTRMQVYSTWNHENGKMVDFLANNVQTNGNLYVNLVHINQNEKPQRHEITSEIKTHLELLKNRSDINVHTYNSNETDGYIVTMTGKNTKYFSRLGANDIEINNRYKLITNEQKIVYESSKNFTMFTIDPYAIMNQYPLTELFKIIDYKLYEKSQKLNRSFVKIDKFNYGWKITKSD